MGRTRLKEEDVIRALESAPQGIDMKQLEAVLGYDDHAIRGALKRLRIVRKAYVLERARLDSGGWKLVYAAGDHDDAIPIRDQVRINTPRGAPAICRAAFQAMPDNPFRVAMCQVGV